MSNQRAILHLICAGIVAALLLCACSGKPNINRQNTYKPGVAKSSPSRRNLPPLPNQSQSRQTKRSSKVPSGSVNSGTASKKTAADIFEMYSPAVFLVFTTDGAFMEQGSGFFISNDGLAVSNYHVFENTYLEYARIKLSDGQVYNVSSIEAKSEENDFIIFRVDIGRQTPYIPIATQQPKVGDKVYTIGSPHGMENTFSSGEISQIRANGDVLQINAPIDHGSSGGVLMNDNGEAIGITTFKYKDSDANLNFAMNIRLLFPYL